jgi:lipid-A-disaccharide synthase-like uncharacterized protein
MIDLSVWSGVGFAGQAFFFTRFLVQWLASERRRESVVPTYFWYFSLGGSALLLSYSLHIRDPVFIVAQSIGLLIYVRNLSLIHGVQFYKRWSFIVVLAAMMGGFALVFRYGEKVGKGMVPLGFAGQAIFTARFVIQWYASEKKGESLVPPLFWYTSLVGGLLLLCYAVQIKNAVFILGQSTGGLVYARNLILIRRKAAKRNPKGPEQTLTETEWNEGAL